MLRNVMTWAVVAVLAPLTAGTPAFAADDSAGGLSLTIGGEAGLMWNPGAKFLVDTTTGTTANVDGNVLMHGGSASLSYRPHEDSFLSGGLFGQSPTISLTGGFWYSGKSQGSLEYDPPANAFINIDGTGIAGNFMSGIYHPDLWFEGMDAAVVIDGEAQPGWSVSPQIGLALSTQETNYSINTHYSNGSNRPIIRGDIDSTAIGLQIGATVNTPEWSGWRIGLTPSARLMAMRSKMTLHQDPYAVTGGLPTMTVTDERTHFVAIPTLELAVERTLGVFNLSAFVKGEYVYGMPYFDLTSGLGDPSKLGTDETAYGFSGGLNVSFNF